MRSGRDRESFDCISKPARPTDPRCSRFLTPRAPHRRKTASHRSEKRLSLSLSRSIDRYRRFYQSAVHIPARPKTTIAASRCVAIHHARTHGDARTRIPSVFLFFLRSETPPHRGDARRSVTHGDVCGPAFYFLLSLRFKIYQTRADEISVARNDIPVSP